jgi:16S rRNA G527 N7-methylase RsmG
VAGIRYPDWHVILVERDLRKAEFLKVAVNELKLSNVEVYAGPVKDLQPESCFNVISRAMAPLPKFLLEARPVMGVGGKAFLFKGDHWSSEFTAIPAQLFEHFEVDLLGTYELPENSGNRYIVQCLKL